VPEQILEKQIDFQIVKDSITISDAYTQNPPDSVYVFYERNPLAATDSTYYFYGNDPRPSGDSLYDILINPLAFPEKPPGYRYEGKPKNQFIPDWAILLITLLFVLLASIRTSSEKYLGQLSQSLYNKNTASRMFRDKVNNLMDITFRLDTFFILVVGILIYHTVNFFMEPSSDTTLVICALSVAVFLVYVFIKFILYRLSGYIFDVNSETQEYIFYTKSSNRIIGLILFPVIIALFILRGDPAEYLLIVGWSVFVIVNIINILRCIKMIAKKVFSIFYMILYLCTLEILPLLIVWKILWKT